MEKEYRVSWLKVFVITLVIFIIIGIIFFIYPKNKNKSLVAKTTYITNINLMKDAGFEYFKGSNLPEKIGSSSQISLEEMIDSKLVMEFVDEKGNSCNLKDSYIKTTKTLDNEYAMKVYLSCADKEDYIVTSIASNVYCPNCNEVASSNDNEDTSNNNSNANYEHDENYEKYYSENYDKNGNYIGSSSSSSSSSNSSSTSSSNSSSSGSPVVNNYYYNNYYTNNNTNNSTNNSNNNTTNNYCGSYNCYCENNCKSNVYYSVNFDSQGGSYVARQLVVAGDTADYRVTTRSGYEFLGWYLDGVKYDFSTPVTRKITLVAKWAKTESKKYQVRFNPNNGDSSFTDTVTDGSTVSRPSDPTRKCYRFLGWYLNGVKYDFSRPVYGNIVLEAKWEEDGSCNAPAKNKYTVNFNSNGGSSVPSETVYEGNRANRPSDPTRKCYTFVAWHINSENGPIYNFNNSVYENINLVAEWKNDGSCTTPTKNKYTVKFDSRGGSNVSSEVVEEGSRASVPRVPTRSGYRFLGWETANGSIFNFQTRIYSDLTLYAKWEKETEQYNKYCKVNNETYYSVSYVGTNQKTWNLNWEIRFDNIHNVDNLKVTEVGYLSSTTDYNNAYNKIATDKGLTKTDGNYKYEVPLTSGSMLKTYSLKSSNFNKSVSTPYYRNGYWYLEANVNIKNYNNVTSYYASNIKSNIYFVPFYFKVKYTDMNNCITDLASRKGSYSNYEIVDTFYK